MNVNKPEPPPVVNDSWICERVIEDLRARAAADKTRNSWTAYKDVLDLAHYMRQQIEQRMIWSEEVRQLREERDQAIRERDEAREDREKLSNLRRLTVAGFSDEMAAMSAERKRDRDRIQELLAANNDRLEQARTAMLVPFLMGKAYWSLRTFGPGIRTKGVCAHIRKELEEIEAEPLDLEEWVDVFMLATDGYWRAWAAMPQNQGRPFSEMALAFVDDIRAKHAKNVARQWPKGKGQDEAIEHVREGGDPGWRATPEGVQWFEGKPR